MEKTYLPLTEKQEEAIIALYESFGFESGLSLALKLAEKKFGKVHSFTIELRKELYSGEGKKLRDKFDTLSNESKLTELLIQRVDND